MKKKNFLFLLLLIPILIVLMGKFNIEAIQPETLPYLPKAKLLACGENLLFEDIPGNCIFKFYDKESKVLCYFTSAGGIHCIPDKRWNDFG